MTDTALNLIFDGSNINKIRKALGKRPGGYRVDPDYIREGIAHKPYFWDVDERKWKMVRLGDMFYMENGIPRKTGR